MAFYLEFDGQNDRVDIGSEIFVSGDGFLFEIDFVYKGTAFDHLVGGSNLFFRINNTASLNLRVDGSSQNLNFNNSLVSGERYYFKLGRTGGTYQLFDENDAPISNSRDLPASPIGISKIGAQFTNANNIPMDFYRLKVNQSGVLIHDYDPSASNGTGSILPDTIGGNDGTLVNFPTDDSQWVFYDDGQGGVDTLVPTLIPSSEVVGTPSVTNLLQLVEANAIPTQEAVQNPVIDAGVILISPATIPTGEVVYNVSVVDLTQFIEAEDIPTQEVVGSPSLELLLSRIFPTAIATQENFETPLLIGGDRIAIPINDRATWNRVAAYLRTRKFSGNDNDVILAWLRSEGYIDTFNDAFNTYLEDVEALDGSLTDKYSNWRRQ